MRGRWIVVLSVLVNGLPSARAGQGDDCRARLQTMEGTLATARRAVRGWVRVAPVLDRFETPQTVAVKPLEFKGLVVEVSESNLWLDQEQMPGADRASQLAELSAKIATIWANYRLLHPSGPPPIRRMYVLFDRSVTVKAAVEVIAVIGRDDILIPLAAPEHWIPALPPSPTLNARLTLFRNHVDAVSAATKWVNDDSLLQHAMGTCKGSLRIPGTGPGDKRSEDEIRSAQHSHVVGLLRACDCRGANIDAIEDVLLVAAGAMARPLQRLPLQLQAVGGEALLADRNALMMSVLVRAAARPELGAHPLTVRAGASNTRNR